MTKALVSVVQVAHDEKKFLAKSLPALLAQDTTFMEIILIDNASRDGTVKFIKDNFPQINLQQNKINVGYARAANQGIRISRGAFILCLDPDVILTKDYVSQCLHVMTRDKSIGVVTGKLLKYDFNKNIKTSVIDSAGLLIYKNRRIFDRGQGEVDPGQPGELEEVFAVCGAAPFIRRVALNATAQGPEEYFDSVFFFGKEEIDLSWRLRLAGWKVMYVPAAVAYHKRSIDELSDRAGIWKIWRARRNLVSINKLLAYRNQRLMQIKNEQWQNFLLDLPKILLRELTILVYIIFFEPRLLSAWWQILNLLPVMLKKRKLIRLKTKLDWRAMRQWLK